MRQIMHYDAEFRREEATSAVGSQREALTAVRVEWSTATNFDPTPTSTPGSPRSGRHPSGA